jgi:uncharacterized protein HemY
MTDPLPTLAGRQALKARLLQRLAQGHDDALLRFTLGRLMLDEAEPEAALPHLQAAVQQQPEHSASWAQLGLCLQRLGRLADAHQHWQQGLAVAARRGDQQALRQMSVWLRAAVKQAGGGA